MFVVVFLFVRFQVYYRFYGHGYLPQLLAFCREHEAQLLRFFLRLQGVLLVRMQFWGFSLFLQEKVQKSDRYFWLCLYRVRWI